MSDYGLSRMKTGELLNTHVGSANYQAPEMFTKDGYTDKVDLYATGITLYMMAYGDFAKDINGNYLDFEDTDKKIDQICIPKDPTVDPDLIDLLGKLTEFDSKERITWRKFYFHPYVCQLSDEQLRRPSEEEFDLHKSFSMECEKEFGEFEEVEDPGVFGSF